MSIEAILGVTFCLLLGGTIGYFLGKKSVPEAESQKEDPDASLQNELITLRTKNNHLVEEIEKLENRIQSLNDEKDQLNKNNNELSVELATIQTHLESSKSKLVEQTEEFLKMKESFKTEFKAIAADTLKEQSKDFKEKNESMLQPFREQIQGFQEVVSKQIERSIKNATSFDKHMDDLQKMNSRISEEAQNLTNALKGDNKQQGNWGELILEKILESSELVKGQEYDTQFSDNNDEEKRIQPDVVIYLPDNKHIIIDSKVSLTAYETFVNSESDQERESALKEHLISLRTHIKGLSEKKYQSAQSLTSPDFILMFIPIESSFSIAVREDISLFNFAWDKKVVIVSPSTLLATLKTVASIWKQEKQNKNVQLIAEESGKLYDKFVGFMEDLDSVEASFKRVSNQLDDAKKKLGTGKGNIIGKVEKLKTLGAKANKQIDPKHLE